MPKSIISDSHLLFFIFINAMHIQVVGLHELKCSCRGKINPTFNCKQRIMSSVLFCALQIKSDT